MSASVKTNITLINRWGLHASAAFAMAKIAREFESEITIEKDEMSADPKNMGQLLLLRAQCGDSLTLEACGTDENEAIDNIVKLIESRFGEGV